MDTRQGTVLASITFLLAACATATTGDARYLQVLAAGRIVAEIDTGAGGMMSCGNQVAMRRLSAGSNVTMQCAVAPSSEALPFTFKAHQRTQESDGFMPSSPYLVRAANRGQCVRMRDATARMEKTVIVEDHCG